MLGQIGRYVLYGPRPTTNKIADLGRADQRECGHDVGDDRFDVFPIGESQIEPASLQCQNDWRRALLVVVEQIQNAASTWLGIGGIEKVFRRRPAPASTKYPFLVIDIWRGENHTAF